MFPTAISDEAVSATERDGQQGFTLAGLIIICTIITLIVAYTVPRQWSRVMQREREKQTIFVMRQYARAIVEYQRHHGALPTTLSQLKDARLPRAVRGPKGEWVDPLTGQVDWLPITQQGASPAVTPVGGTPTPTTTDTTGTPGTSGTTATTATTAGTVVPGTGGTGTVGPFIGVRPNKKGDSMLAVNGAEQYEGWSYTINDLQNESTARMAAYASVPGVAAPAVQTTTTPVASRP
jgi:type II secretory pathway pseudopilin PulG